jgi:peroxiredoxin
MPNFVDFHRYCPRFPSTAVAAFTTLFHWFGSHLALHGPLILTFCPASGPGGCSLKLRHVCTMGKMLSRFGQKNIALLLASPGSAMLSQSATSSSSAGSTLLTVKGVEACRPLRVWLTQSLGQTMLASRLVQLGSADDVVRQVPSMLAAHPL